MYHPEGYKKLLTWQQGMEIYQLTKDFTAKYLDPIKDARLIAHMNDEARSVPQNIAEGNKRGNTRAYLDFLGFSRASNEELKGDYEELKREYKEGIRKVKIGKNKEQIGKNKEEMIREIDEILTKIYGEDCMLGRQIAGLEKRFVAKGSEQEKLSNSRKDCLKKQISDWNRW